MYIHDLSENHIYRDADGDAIQWSMVIEGVSSNDKFKALENGDYADAISDYEEESLAKARMTAFLERERECAENGRTEGDYDVTYILYDKENDELIMKIDDVIIIEW